MSVSQADKAKKLRALHEAPGAFVIPNPWDAGSARVLDGLGFQALATSSGAKAGVPGERDGKVTRDEALANARLIAGAVDIPVIGDLENGFGDAPDGRRHHPAGAGDGRAGRRLDRGRHRQQGRAPVRYRRGGGARDAAVAAAKRSGLPVRADRAGRGLPARATPTWTTSSSGSRPSRRPAPMC